MEVHCAAAEIALQVHSGATDVQQAKPLGFTFFLVGVVFLVYFGFVWLGFFVTGMLPKNPPEHRSKFGYGKSSL